MKKVVTAVMVAVLMTAVSGWAQEPPKMKMTTEIPEGIATQVVRRHVAPLCRDGLAVDRRG